MRDAQNPHDIVRRAFAAVNERDAGAIDDIYAAHHEYRDPRCPKIERGLTGVRRVLTTLTSAAPDLRYDILEVADHGDQVRVKWTLTGTHLGRVHDVPASGRRIEVTGTSTFRVEIGKIVETVPGVSPADVIGELAGDPTLGRCP